MAKFNEVKQMSTTGLKHAIDQHKFTNIIVDLKSSYVIVPEGGFNRKYVHTLTIYIFYKAYILFLTPSLWKVSWFAQIVMLGWPSFRMWWPEWMSSDMLIYCEYSDIYVLVSLTIKF